jgi:hypothetical protein
MNRLLVSVFWVLLALVSLPSVLAQDSDWPRTLPLEQGMVTIYSLQVDDMDNGTMHFRAALAYRATPGSEPVFGAGWFESKVEIDSINRIVHPTNLKLTETRFPAGTDDVQAELSAVLAQESPAWNLDFSLDELEAALKTAETESMAVNTTPPQIIYRDHPALLISLDGEPVLREIKNSPYEAVINTPYPLIFDGKHYYLNAAKDVWYRASKATGPYKFEARPPKDLAAMVNAEESGEAVEAPVEPVTAANAPEIVVSTQPAELIVTEGPAAFVPLVDDLLVLQNSSDDVFMHVSSQKFYIVIAGRWYRAGSLNGPWTYQLADELPSAFANIPQDSDQADSRVYVAGTPEARDAVLDAQVPQTAAVARGEVDIKVEYDGSPIYAPVNGTGLTYIQNTGSTVILSDGLYYLVEDGVWYVSSSANGPWQVSDHRPAQVDTILPTSPVYNVKYVHVYDSTPSVVYVGYTPGYTGSYVYHDTIVYGSGWYYSPWVSPYYYYPRHSTWGFNVSYNYWGGWNYGLSWGWGPFSVSYYSGGYWHNNHYWHHRHYGRWGAGRYRARPVHHGYGHDRYAHNSYRRNGYSYNGYGHDTYNRHSRSNYRPVNDDRHDNLYRDSSQRARITDTRDKRAGNRDGRRGNTRQANYMAASGSRQKNYTGIKNGERNRTGHVSPSEIRLKAQVRDTNSAASRSRLLADNSGNVYRGAERGQTRQANYIAASNSRQKNYTGTKKGERNRTTPVTRDRQQIGIMNSSRKNRKSDAIHITPSRTVASSRAATRQQSSRTVNTPVRQTQTRIDSKKYRQRVTPVASTHVRQTTPRVGGKSTKQRSSRVVSAPVQRQNTVRASSQPQRTQPQRTQHGARNNPAPTQYSSKKASNKASSQKNRPNSGGHKRNGGERSRGKNRD